MEAGHKHDEEFKKPTKVGDIVRPIYFYGIEDWLPWYYGFYIDGREDADRIGSIYKIDTAGTYDIYYTYTNGIDSNDIQGVLYAGRNANGDTWSDNNLWNGTPCDFPVSAQNKLDDETLKSVTVQEGDTLVVYWMKDSNMGAGWIYVRTTYLKRVS